MFIVGWLWVTGLWTIAVIPNSILPSLPHPLILLTQSVIVQRRKDTDVKMK
jgi:hypothetical protein